MYKLLLPKSIPGLLISGFVIVALPLVLSNMRAFLVVDDLSNKSEALVVAGAEIIRDTQIADEELVSLERTIRTYQIVEDDQQLDQFANIAARLISRIELLKTIVADPDAANAFDAVSVQLETLAEPFSPPKEQRADADLIAATLTNLQAIREEMRRVTVQSQGLVNAQVNALRQSASDARTSVFWQSISVLALTLVLVMLGTYFINRPIRQTISAIRGLGHGKFENQVAIDGPAELTSLGEELNWLRVRLDEADREKDRFMKRISHDLKTPLASIREGVELLHDELIGDLNSEQREVCSIIRDSSVDLQVQIDNLLNFKLSDALDPSTEMETFKISDVVKTVRDQHRLTLLNHAIALSVDGSHTTITGDREKLRIALDNLLSNAIKISPPNSTIRITVRKRSDVWEIDVKDQGPGIAKADRSLIFKPFYQGQAPQNTQINGTGLGLSVARDCVEAQGGQLDLVSSGPDGACFRIQIPISNQDSASIAHKENKDKAAKTRNLNRTSTPLSADGARADEASVLSLRSSGSSATIVPVSNPCKAYDHDSTPNDSSDDSSNRNGNRILRPVAGKVAAS